jgi:hypothetical protein
MIYKIKGWETEECREEGFAFTIEEEENLDEAIELAQSYYSEGLACIEVIDEECRCHYHNSEDGESYYFLDEDTNKMVEVTIIS